MEDRRTITLTQAEFIDATNRSYIEGLLGAAQSAKEAAVVVPPDAKAATALVVFAVALEATAAEARRKKEL